jgi:Fur family ferric uptake transcriptional regulator
VDCEKVFEFCDPRILEIQRSAATILGFEITNHSLNLYGKCNKLASKGACENKKIKEKKSAL